MIKFEDEKVAFRMDWSRFQGPSCVRIAHSREHIEVLWGRVVFTPKLTKVPYNYWWKTTEDTNILDFYIFFVLLTFQLGS